MPAAARLSMCARADSAAVWHGRLAAKACRCSRSAAWCGAATAGAFQLGACYLLICWCVYVQAGLHYRAAVTVPRLLAA